MASWHAWRDKMISEWDDDSSDPARPLRTLPFFLLVHHRIIDSFMRNPTAFSPSFSWNGYRFWCVKNRKISDISGLRSYRRLKLGKVNLIDGRVTSGASLTPEVAKQLREQNIAENEHLTHFSSFISLHTCNTCNNIHSSISFPLSVWEPNNFFTIFTSHNLFDSIRISKFRAPI